MAELKSTDTGGVKPMSIAGRTVFQREREIGMTDEERKWRAQWLKDQHLTAREPVHVPELERQLRNPFRRLYRFPLDYAEQLLVPKYGLPVRYARYLTGKLLIFSYLMIGASYYFNYHGHSWKEAHGWVVKKARRPVLPGDPGYPAASDKTKPSDYFSQGFDKVTLHFGKD